jgi:hypothetical protein
LIACTRWIAPFRIASGGQVGAALAQFGQLALPILFASAPAGLVLLFLQRLALDLQLHDRAVDLIQLLRLGVDLHAQPAGRLVDQVDGLVGQEAVGDVAVAERGRGNDGAVGDAHAVMHFVALLEPAQDADRVLDTRLLDKDGLEAPLQGGVLLDVLAIFVQRGGADGVQFAAGQHRLEHVGGIHRPLGGARADQRVHLVDKEDDLALGFGHFLQHGLEPLLELAAIFGAGDQRAQIERHQRLSRSEPAARRR